MIALWRFEVMSAACDPSGQPVPAPARSILVVEDDVLVRTVAAAYLRDCGFEVIEAGSADEAVRVLQAALVIDLVFSDVNMPGDMDGLGLVRWLRRERPELGIILTSGALGRALTTDDLGERGLFLAKPYDFSELVRRIHALLTR